MNDLSSGRFNRCLLVGILSYVQMLLVTRQASHGQSKSQDFLDLAHVSQARFRLPFFSGPGMCCCPRNGHVL